MDSDNPIPTAFAPLHAPDAVHVATFFAVQFRLVDNPYPIFRSSAPITTDGYGGFTKIFNSRVIVCPEES